MDLQLQGKHALISGGSKGIGLACARGFLQEGAKVIRVNAINPGITFTERMQEGLEADARLHNITQAEARKRASASLPLGRIATPEEIANAVLFLCSPKASYISGAILAMDGAVTPMVV